MPPDTLDLFGWSPPAVEPTPEHFVRSPDDPRDYSREFAAWRTEHPEVYAWIERTAIARYAAGLDRIEVNDLWADARRTFKVRANNSFRAACARTLLAEHPALAGAIRIRAARRTK